jgi:hypothetical protein
MEDTHVHNQLEQPLRVGEIIPEILDDIEVVGKQNHFIEANTVSASVATIRDGHIIPVFIKDNEPVISHAEFIDATVEVVSDIFGKKVILAPDIRLSHPIKGRVPEAKKKPSNELLEHEKTIYYERMAFVIEIPDIQTVVDGNILNLTVGGVKAYNLDNLYNRNGADQHFKIFIGFQNKVCTNMCVATDGALSNLKVKDLNQLQGAVHTLVRNYNVNQLSEKLKSYSDYELSEKQFVHLVGRCRLYKHMPERLKDGIRELMFGDSQINTICREYYADANFKSFPDGSINLWRLYNLFTGANKATYVDNFLDRSINAYELINDIQYSLQNSTRCWYLN